jgi:hypothetical protein
MMGEIYSNARIVYIWLGLATNKTANAVKLLATLIVAIRDIDAAYPIEYNQFSVNGYNPAADAEIRGFMDSLSGHADQLLLRDLFGRSYWSRLWIVHEVLLAQVAQHCFVDTSDINSQSHKSKGG